ncbi:MAG: right-handed parallel beta-helix repeat-containing protein [Candidatus Hydrogenedentales bacterium]|jgi:parallel beta-helix repeat protein
MKLRLGLCATRRTASSRTGALWRFWGRTIRVATLFLEKLGPQGRCVNHVVSQNKVRANGAYGIILEATENCMVLGNKSYENGKDGIAVDSTNGPAQFNAIVGNRCAENAGTGVHIGTGSLSTCVEGNRETRNARARSAHP